MADWSADEGLALASVGYRRDRSRSILLLPFQYAHEAVSDSLSFPMSLKSDTWIRKMALEHGMIEPFVEQQVKKANNGSSGIISYGLSSYGYDLRVSNEFKVFTNVFNTVVDPKNFDAKSFVDLESDVCIVPPNSFALARSIECFRLPRDILAICLGKSTYARC